MSERLTTAPRSSIEVHRLLNSGCEYEPGGPGGTYYEWWNLYGSLKLGLARDAATLLEAGEQFSEKELLSLSECMDDSERSIAWRESGQIGEHWPEDASTELAAIRERLSILTLPLQDSESATSQPVQF